MSSLANPVAKGKNDNKGATGRGGRKETYEKRERTKINKSTNESNIDEYTTEQRSKFGEAFLPFANQLESIEKTRIERKRRGKKGRNKLTRITQLPKYDKNKVGRINEYNNKRDSNVIKICEKQKGMKLGENNVQEK